jgi:VWFA-related protein
MIHQKGGSTTVVRTTGRRKGASWTAASLLVGAACLLSLNSRLQAQQDPVFSTDVNVVNVLATVRDKQGQIVRNLTQDDFILEENGRPQTIRYFSQGYDLPLTIGLVVDTSPSQARLLEDERSASYDFLDQVLREDKDQAFVIQFDQEVELLQDLTSSRRELSGALDSLHVKRPTYSYGGGQPGRGWPRGGGGWPGGGGGWPGGGGGWPGASRFPIPGPGGTPGPVPGPRSRQGGGTALYDAIYLAADEVIREQAGRKALIFLTDGVDTASKTNLEQAIESAQRSDTLVYTILYADPGAYRNSGGFGGGMGSAEWQLMEGRRILARISKETGARMFEVTGSESIGRVYSTIEEELRSQYNLGYTPETEGRRDGYRRIQLTTRQKDLTVQSREGYYPGS